MVNVGYTLGIPVTNNDPSVDQPNMTVNNDAVPTILAVDHISFNAPNGGTHKQVTFSSENTPGAQTDPASTLYTAAGTASSIAELFWKNQSANFQAIPIRAWGVFNPNAISLAQTINVSGIVKNAVGNYTVTLNTNVCGSSNYGVLFTVPMTSFSVGGICGYQITSATTFNLFIRSLTSNSGVDLAPITFAVLQI